MATQKMFSDLDKLELGDVLPADIGRNPCLSGGCHPYRPAYDTSFLGITEGEDYCTLVTCTPFGINTHRLLVRGTRIPSRRPEVITAEKLQVEDTPASTLGTTVYQRHPAWHRNCCCNFSLLHLGHAIARSANAVEKHVSVSNSIEKAGK